MSVGVSFPNRLRSIPHLATYWHGWKSTCIIEHVGTPPTCRSRVCPPALFTDNHTLDAANVIRTPPMIGHTSDHRAVALPSSGTAKPFAGTPARQEITFSLPDERPLVRLRSARGVIELLQPPSPPRNFSGGPLDDECNHATGPCPT